jgi:ribose-phosphate pyrophosphokinase
MIDTAGTIVAAAKALRDNGAGRVIVAATHAVFSDPAVERLSSDAVDNVIVTNTLPIPADKHFDKLTVLSIAPLISRAISSVFEDNSVTELFDGHV